MNKSEFMQVSAEEIADLIQRRKAIVCAFPFNGTRRWFLLEHSPVPEDVDLMAHYMEMAGHEHVRLFKMVFEHGVSTLLSPTFGPDIMARDKGYRQMALKGMRALVEDPKFLEFYAEYGVRVRFYGEYRKYFAGTEFEFVSELFDDLTERTAHHTQNRLFWGIFAHDAVQPIADLSVQYFQETGKVPQKEDLVAMYYGESVAPVDFFIGFDKFASFDMPMLTTGSEDLYFTVAPSLYMSHRQFREILYDHLFTRREKDADYEQIQPEGWAAMRAFYQANYEKTLGLGEFHREGMFWYPNTQVTFPDEIEANTR